MKLRVAFKIGSDTSSFIRVMAHFWLHISFPRIERKTLAKISSIICMYMRLMKRQVSFKIERDAPNFKRVFTFLLEFWENPNFFTFKGICFAVIGSLNTYYSYTAFDIQPATSYILNICLRFWAHGSHGNTSRHACV